MEERLLSFKEVCERLGVHPNTLRRWDRQGKIKVVRTVGG
ncbi:MAG: MerR family DNA-binding transcriptional regulator [Nitrososphaerota archaeon]|nr:MerR family DNA-binding transcriptional regulator [Nitrososphaerota archaeon]